MVSGIVRLQSLVYDRLQRLELGGVDAVDGGGGHPTALTGAGMDPALLFEIVIQFF